MDLFSYKVWISFNGLRFSGFQIQPQARTVQEELEKVLSKYFEMPIRITPSGRTDGGVHAAALVFGFLAHRQVEGHVLTALLNYYLPEDIHVLKSSPVDVNFHSRYDAKVRHYRYRIINAAAVPPKLIDRYYFKGERIDACGLNEYFQPLVGVHDFTSFASSRDESASKVREIFKIDTHRIGNEIIIDLYGNAFLMNMVRKIVGTALFLYRKKQKVHQVVEILESRDPKLARHTAPAEGLTLEGVYYTPLFGDREYYEKK